ncbi:hypothetical protein GGR53DRAFT_529573 [Hypoxylon sp. FL1150]|nr:hypothetical protein GGR53DRAFT_529573 [Hypoxylon sp. FL1150]
MSDTLSKKQHKALLDVPEKDFDYGGLVQLDQQEWEQSALDGYTDEEVAAALRKETLKDMSQQPHKARAYVVSKFNQVDSELIENAKTSYDYWQAILSTHRIRTSFNLQEVIHHIASIRPHTPPSETKLYVDIMRKLKTVADYREKNDCKLKGMTTFDLPSDPQLEAVRIYGDGRKGFGCYPISIEYHLWMTGLVWLVRIPKTRKLPPFWIEYYRIHKGLEQRAHSQSRPTAKPSAQKKQPPSPQNPLEAAMQKLRQTQEDHEDRLVKTEEDIEEMRLYVVKDGIIP